MLCQGEGGGSAFPADRKRHALAEIGGAIDGRGPAQAQQSNRQSCKDGPEDELAPVLPLAAEQGENQQRDAEQSRKDAESADGLDLEHHDAHQHEAEHRHPGAEEQQTPTAQLCDGRAGLPLEHQGEQSQQQHGQVGQAAEQGEGLAEQGAPGAVEHLVAGFGAAGAGEGTDQPPALEGDRARVDRTDRGQHGHCHAQPASAWILPAPLAGEALAEAGGSHDGLRVQAQFWQARIKRSEAWCHLQLGAGMAGQQDRRQRRPGSLARLRGRPADAGFAIVEDERESCAVLLPLLQEAVKHLRRSLGGQAPLETPHTTVLLPGKPAVLPGQPLPIDHEAKLLDVGLPGQAAELLIAKVAWRGAGAGGSQGEQEGDGRPGACRMGKHGLPR